MNQTYSERRRLHWHRRRTLTPVRLVLLQGWSSAVVAVAHSEAASLASPDGASAPQRFSEMGKKFSCIIIAGTIIHVEVGVVA